MTLSKYLYSNYPCNIWIKLNNNCLIILFGSDLIVNLIYIVMVSYDYRHRVENVRARRKSGSAG